MRRPMVLIPAMTLGLLAFLPPVAAEESVVAGFTGIQTHAQGQAATGYFFAVGEEENRLVGALSEINNPPAGSKNIAAKKAASLDPRMKDLVIKYLDDWYS